MSDVHYYEVAVKWDRDRIGMLTSPTLQELQVATPPEFPKGVPGIWSPEHLFVSAANSCLMTTFLSIAENSKLEFESFSCGAKGKLEKVEGKFMISEIELAPKIKVKNDADRERALRIIEKAEHNCLISNSMKSKIILNPEII
ncbi:MAG TPA: OsmC family protein [Ignavibacteriales bacterium]|nr:OsmC family protein [Ignavibacteriales bacterium]